MSGYMKVIITVTILMLTACGQSGPLYLPHAHPTPSTQQNSSL